MTVAVAAPADPTTTPTLDEPAVDLFAKYPELDAVRREINRIRTERGGDPIYELPAGQCDDARTCVLAVALDAFVGTSRFYSPPESRDPRPLPGVLYDFVFAFDSGRYPELVQP